MQMQNLSKDQKPFLFWSIPPVSPGSFLSQKMETTKKSLVSLL